MSIKKSSLENKWYYRVAKILFLALFPLLFLVFFFNGKIDINNLSSENILNLLKGSIIYAVVGLVLYYLVLIGIWRGFLYIAFGGLKDDTKKKSNGTNQSPTPVISKQSKAAQIIPIAITICIFVVIGLSQAGYIKLPKIDIDNITGNHTYGAACMANGKSGLYGTNGDCYTCSESTAHTSRINSNCSNGTAGVYCCTGGNDNSGCISTNCGHMWYCSGSYYIGGQEIRVPGLCFPVHPNQVYSGWTGTCRRCP
ncbi:MAG: hypothetical protein WC242_03875 [Candidatus Paceibacterota bacterium]|jgi:hypothetical protein